MKLAGIMKQASLFSSFKPSSSSNSSSNTTNTSFSNGTGTKRVLENSIDGILSTSNKKVCILKPKIKSQDAAQPMIRLCLQKLDRRLFYGLRTIKQLIFTNATLPTFDLWLQLELCKLLVQESKSTRHTVAVLETIHFVYKQSIDKTTVDIHDASVQWHDLVNYILDRIDKIYTYLSINNRGYFDAYLQCLLIHKEHKLTSFECNNIFSSCISCINNTKDNIIIMSHMTLINILLNMNNLDSFLRILRNIPMQKRLLVFTLLDNNDIQKKSLTQTVESDICFLPINVETNTNNKLSNKISTYITALQKLIIKAKEPIDLSLITSYSDIYKIKKTKNTINDMFVPKDQNEKHIANETTRLTKEKETQQIHVLRNKEFFKKILKLLILSDVNSLYIRYCMDISSFEDDYVDKIIENNIKNNNNNQIVQECINIVNNVII